MGSSASKGSARRYPSAAARAGLDSVLQPPPRHTLLNQEPESLASIVRSADEATKVQQSAGTAATVDEEEPVRAPTPEVSKVKDAELLGLEDFEAPGSSYNSQLNKMLKSIGPIAAEGNITVSNNVQTNPIAMMFRARDSVSDRVMKEQEDESIPRTLFTAGELGDILEASKSGKSKSEIMREFRMSEEAYEKLGSAFTYFGTGTPGGAEENESYGTLQNHGVPTWQLELPSERKDPKSDRPIADPTMQLSRR
ncbi:uncharacterized protein V1516DRAFT_672463 [Lipomyces oligophaga]|uniref:uncharacterized protein n=1 Tax=Lipomyces oligophaga TaxID=45792 RepID=UPI0034CF532B